MVINRSTRQYNATFKAVIECPLQENEVPLIPKYLPAAQDLIEAEDMLAMTGYEVSYRYNPKHDNYSVCIKGVMSDCVNLGYWLYGNGESVQMAKRSAYWKHFELFRQAAWSDRASQTSSIAS